MPGNINFYTALLGFREMGFECVLYRNMEELAESSCEDVVVGGLGPVRNALTRHGVTIEELDYPAELQPYMGRKVWSSTVDEVASDRSLWPVFVKSSENKRLTGKVVSSSSIVTPCLTSAFLTGPSPPTTTSSREESASSSMLR